MSSILTWGTPAATPPSSFGVTALDGLQPIVDALGVNGGLVQLGDGDFYGDPANPSTPLTVPAAVTLRGLGVAKTRIKSPILISSASAGIEYLTVRPSGTSYGVRIYNGGSPFIARCWFKQVFIGASSKGAGDGPVNGLELDGAGVLEADQLTCAFCTGYGLLADSTGLEPNTTLKFDVCSFVQNTLGGARLLQSMTIAEFNGGNMEDNGGHDFYAENAAGIGLLGVDFEHSATHFTITNSAEMQNCNTIRIVGCNFLKTGGTTRGFLLSGCNGINVGGNRFEGWGANGVFRISETCTNAVRWPNHIHNGNGWEEDYSR